MVRSFCHSYHLQYLRSCRRSTSHLEDKINTFTILRCSSHLENCRNNYARISRLDSADIEASAFSVVNDESVSSAPSEAIVGIQTNSVNYNQATSPASAASASRTIQQKCRKSIETQIFFNMAYFQKKNIHKLKQLHIAIYITFSHTNIGIC